MGASTWDKPTEAVKTNWKTDTGVSLGDASWPGDAPGDASFISAENTSKHANAVSEDAPRDGGCRVCGEDGHFARDCPDKPANSGECYNCGEVGHNKSDCNNPRVEREFNGTCRICEQEGHRAAECPERPPQRCMICGEEGHRAADCSANRIHSMFAAMEIEEKPAELAWRELEEADKEKDVDDIKRAIFTYAKAFPLLTLQELELAFRDADMNTYIIAKEQVVSDTHTIINLQGNKDQKFVVSFQFSSKPKRPKFAEGWPSSPEENLERLAEAGFVMDGFVTKCINCGELGHMTNNCPEEKQEPTSKIGISCANCNEDGHRARDCTQERKSSNKGCRNCGSEEHMAKECTEPRTDIECRGCGEAGHMSRDCPSRKAEICRNCQEEGHRANDCTNERVMKCRNCDELGHMGKECTKQTDWSRVQCTNCKEMGHSIRRCSCLREGEAVRDDGAAGSGGGGWNDSTAPTMGGTGAGGWENDVAPAPVESSGGW